MSKSKRITISIDKFQLAIIDELAARLCSTRNSIIRLILESVLINNDSQKKAIEGLIEKRSTNDTTATTTGFVDLHDQSHNGQP